MKVKKLITGKPQELEFLWMEESDGLYTYYLPEEAEIGELIELPTVDWEQQAALSPYFSDGLVRLPVNDKELLLQPGPGFGDLSHPTTRLMLSLMEKEVEDKRLLDLGCGNGVLALAGLLLGAKSAVGVDIEPEAIDHANQNAELNNLSCSFILPPCSADYDLMLLNMTLGEQQQALAANGWPEQVIVSGLLEGQQFNWIEQGYSITREVTEGEWWAGLCSK